LWTVGPVTLDSRLHALEERVVQTPYQPWSRLPRLVASADISLAPLEAANAFTEAKSCLKYLEAALLGVPTIASSRSDFRRAIDDGVNGRLADDPATWREALESLVESPHTRTRIGAAALDDVLAKHTTGARAVETARAFAAAGGGAAE
jgi:glycosyltransferase involved in cell wall biosynthesis